MCCVFHVSIWFGLDFKERPAILTCSQSLHSRHRKRFAIVNNTLTTNSCGSRFLSFKRIFIFLAQANTLTYENAIPMPRCFHRKGDFQGKWPWFPLFCTEISQWIFPDRLSYQNARISYYAVPFIADDDIR